MFSIQFNNATDEDFGIKAIKRPNLPCAEKEIESVSVKGADETLTRCKNDGYKNITITIEYNFIDTEDFSRKCRQIKKWLCGTIKDRKLRFSDDYDVYYIVKNVKIGNIERQWKILGRFTVDFECSPYAWLEHGQDVTVIPKDKALTLYNDYLLAKPNFIIKGNGTVEINMNGNKVKVLVGGEVTINTVLQKTYKDNKVVGLALQSGTYKDLWLQEEDNTISYKVISGTIDSIEMIPNYKTL